MKLCWCVCVSFCKNACVCAWFLVGPIYCIADTIYRATVFVFDKDNMLHLMVTISVVH